MKKSEMNSAICKDRDEYYNKYLLIIKKTENIFLIKIYILN